MKSVLMIVTSHDRLGDTGKPTGFWLEEYAVPYYAFTDAGLKVTVASPKGGQPPLDPNSAMPDFQTDATRRFDTDAKAKAQLASTLVLSSVKAADYDAVFYPGGHGPLWDLATDKASLGLIETMAKAGKVVAAVCHGPAALLKAEIDGLPLVRGREVTGFTNSEEAAVGLTEVVPFSIEDEITRLGGKYKRGADWGAFVVTDGQLVTGQNPSSSEATASAVIALLG
jgi:putative intracellular protease/amidase